MDQDKVIKIGDSVVGSRMFGGYVYNLSCEIGGSQSPSSVTLRIVNDGGEYSLPRITPSADTNESINIGNGMFFKGKLVSYNKNISPELSTLEVKYIDGSFVLDQWYVGLHKRHGYNRVRTGFNRYSAPSKAGAMSPYLIIVGKEYHPCDTNFDSSVNGSENQIKIDWCDPCPFAPPDKYGLSCVQDAELDMEILEVKYTFNELLDKLPVKIKKRPSGEFTKNPKEYVGSLRSVIQSWCSDFGFSFYWDFQTNELVFIDLKSGIKLNLEKNYKDLSEYSETVSCEETSSRGVISYYERQGMRQSYSCEDDRVITLHPFYITDLFSSDVKDGSGLLPGGTKSKSASQRKKQYLESKEIASALSYYSSSLRDIYWFYNHYKITSVEQAIQKRTEINAKPKVSNSEKGTSGSLEPAGDLTPDAKDDDEEENLLKELGNMRILGVIAPTGSAEGIDEGWSTLVNQLGDERAAIIKEETKKNGGTSPYYFIVVENNLETLSSQFDQEANIASNFMGRFWYRVYSPVIPAGEDNAPNISIDAPDASAEFLVSGAGIPGHPLAGFGHDKGSYIDKLLAEVADEEKTQDASFTAVEGDTQIQKQYKVKKNLVVAERDSKWYPHSSNVDYYSGPVDYLVNNFGLWLVGNEGRPDALMRLSKFKDAAKENKNIRIYCVREGRSKKEFPITKTNINNFYETKQMKKIRKTLLKDSRNSDKPYEKNLILGAHGLTSDDCRWVTFDGFGFMMPVGGCFFKDEQKVKKSLTDKMNEETEKFRNMMASPRKSLLEGGTGSLGTSSSSKGEFYKVRVRQTYDVPVYLPKLQLPFVGALPAVTMKHDFYFNELSQIEKELKAGACTPNISQVQAAHNLAYNYLSYSNSENTVSANFTLYGIMPKKISIEEGLDSVNITIDDNGAKTSYTLSSKYREIPDANIQNKIIESLSYRLSHRAIGGNLNSQYRPPSLPSN